VTRGSRFYRPAAFVAGILLSSAVAGCNQSNTTGPSISAAYSQSDLRLGTGTEAAAGKNVTVTYTGWLYDPTKVDHKGLQFDSNVDGTPFTFTLGTQQVIAGWDQGLPGMKVGGLRQLTIPAALAYGGIRNGPIPPFASLVFEIELDDVQ
jgi:FKBP-type peptidyl-prolyl cis-trans isomerase FkpA